MALFRFSVTVVIGLCSLTSLSAQAAKPDLSLLPYGSKPDLVALPNRREIHMVCMGRGSPTVVMTAGLSDGGGTWNKVQPLIARKVRVCAWDHAELGFSGPSPGPQTVDRTTTDLERALTAAKIHGPYILVVHSSRSYETLLFKDRHPTEVIGMVLVDPPYTDQAILSARDTPMLAAATRAWDEGGTAISLRCAARLESGALKVGRADPDGCLSIPKEYPDGLRERSLRLYTKPEMWKTAASLFATFVDSSRLVVNKDRTYGAMPLRVLTADMLLAAPNASAALGAEMPKVRMEWQRQHDRLATLSSRGVNIRVAGTDTPFSR